MYFTLNQGTFSQRLKNDKSPKKEIINGKVILGRGIDLNVPLPIYLPKDRKGNYEVEIDKSGHTGPGEFGVPVKTEASEKAHVDEVIKEFGFNLVNSDKISMDR